MNKTDVIGNIEKVSLPDVGLADIPAKIDTGADSSSIWASDISIDDAGSLTFSLFGPGSKYFSGNKVVAETYRQSQIKNSFGVSELRYKVNFTVGIGRRRIRAWFTLADRSGMNYPILLGRRTLMGKFLVDVGKKHLSVASHAGSSQVLVLGAPESRVQDFFSQVAEASAKKPEFVARSLSQLAFWLDDTKLAIQETTTGRDIADFDLVYFKTHRRYYEFAVAAADYLKFNHIRFFDRELEEPVCYDKLSEAVRLATSGLAIPKSVCASSSWLRENLDQVGDFLGWPQVMKEINSDRGKKNFYLENPSGVIEVLADAGPRDTFLLQKYIENDGYQRLYVFGSKVALAIARTPEKHADPKRRHLNNPAGGGNARLVPVAELPAAQTGLAVAAARSLGRQVAGVDLIEDKSSGRWLILEVNGAPQIRGGSFTEDKIKAFAKFIDFELDK